MWVSFQSFSPCAFCEQEGHLAAPSPSFGGRALREHRRSSGSIPPLLAPTGKSILLLERDDYLGRVGNGV